MNAFVIVKVPTWGSCKIVTRYCYINIYTHIDTFIFDIYSVQNDQGILNHAVNKRHLFINIYYLQGILTFQQK